MRTKDAYDFAAKRAQYRRASTESLRFAASDIVATLDAWNPGHHPNEGWYLDDLHTVKAELRRREGERNLRTLAQAACQTPGCVGLLPPARHSCPQCEAILAALRKVER